MRFFVLIIFAPIIFPAAVFPQEVVRISGHVLAAADSLPVPFAHVVNYTSFQATTSNEKGFFQITAIRGDSLSVTAIGFESQSFTALVSKGIIYLEKSFIQIDTVVIRAMPSKEFFPSAFLNLKLPEENTIQLHLPENPLSVKLPLVPEDIKVKAPNEIASPGGIVITFGGAPALHKQEEAFTFNKNLFDELERKFNNKFISALTGISDEETLVEFKKFCSLTNEFILENGEYEIAVALLDCLKEFRKP